VRVVDAVPMGATGRLAVVEFSGKRLLVAVSRGQISLLAEAPAPASFPLADDGGDA
jgi:flagellar protein FliO/FliZ